MTKYIKILLIFSLLLTTIPLAVFIKNDNPKNITTTDKALYELDDYVKIMNNDGSVLSEIPVNDYLIGCVLAQIPCDFDLEALKCQAIIARTYIFYHQYHNKNPYTLKNSYFTEQEAKEFYKENYENALDKATLAVYETDGLILTYNNAPIVTAFHPVSAGYTESSEDIWGEPFDYLKSVRSQYDDDYRQNPQVIQMTAYEFYARLFSHYQYEAGENPQIEIKEMTKNKTVKSVVFFDEGIKKEITGGEFAEIFNLNSCNFHISIKDNLCVITCYGAGHLVGLSQWGSNNMALSGKSYEEILTFYFQGVSLLKLK